MKKNILRMFVVFTLILSCSLCLVACGNADKKKEEELAGKYELTQLEYTVDEHTEVVTKAQYEEMPDGPMKTVLSDYFGEYEVKLDDHKVWKGEDDMVTWKVSDGKLVVEPVEAKEGVTFSAEIVDGNIVITYTDSSNTYFDTAKLTLAKVA
ncbi:MAG: hypothetical protein J6X00_01595 [Clostridia bacterium]|nr:hypothetical protein [Clostridia bacterium]